MEISLVASDPGRWRPLPRVYESQWRCHAVFLHTRASFRAKKMAGAIGWPGA